MIRTRFAPSPTGYLHVGGLRTALYAYLVAKQAGGQFIVRIEDTDRERFVEGAIESLLKALYWTGIKPDEGVLLDEELFKLGEYRPMQKGSPDSYIQSERLPIYQEHIKPLLEKGVAYYCFCTQERLEELRKKQELNKQASCYDGLCRRINSDEAKQRAEAGETHVVRMHMPKTGETTFVDLVRGKITFANNLIDDQVLIKSDGFPTYHFAVVVDDHLMNITHVIRGEEWISSTPKHLKLYEYFGWEPPQFAHLSLILNPDKSKLSKRQGDVAVEDYQAKGYLPEALVNFISFLGWNPGGDRELFALPELVKEFNLEKVSKAGAVFNIEKLNWYNREYLKKMSAEEVTERARVFGFPVVDLKQLVQFVALEKDRVTTLAELPEAIKFCFELPDYAKELLVWRKGTPEEAKMVLGGLIELLSAITDVDWTRENLEKMVGEFIAQKGLSNGAVLSPLRVALSGQQNSPGPYEIALALGKMESVARLTSALQKLA
jgi:glutamyl-tRNA synthetase